MIYEAVDMQLSLERAGRQKHPCELDRLKVKGRDGALVQRAQSGDHRAFSLLMRKYRHHVMKLAMRYTRNRADADDVVQETFIKAYWGLRHFRGDAEFYSWLHRIAVNTAKTWLAFRARNAGMFVPATTPLGDTNVDFVVPKDLDSPEDLALTDEIGVAVNSAIQALCEEQRIAITLREFRGLNYSQVAAAMSCPIGTVRSRVFRAREAIDRKLRAIFDDGLGRHRCNGPSQSRREEIGSSRESARAVCWR